MKGNPKYVVVTPVRDEALHIEKTIASVIGQTVRPWRWVIVNDGSTDATGAIVDATSAGIDWIKVVHLEDRGYRAAGGGVIRAFNIGYSDVDDDDWEFLVKLDGDLSFEPDYFQKCLARFEADANLGIGGGAVYQVVSGVLKVDSGGDPPFHVRGATKIYRRACWQMIAPLVPAPGWDTIDEVRANLHGWTTRTFSDLKLVQHKPTGSADGNWRNAYKNGRANYITGYHPVFMLAKCIKRAAEEPILVQSAALFAGFCSGYLARLPRLADQETIRYLRGQQIRRLLLRPSIYG